MADITINDPNGNFLQNLDSADGTTIGDLFAVLGVGVLKKDGVLKANPDFVLTAGTYTLDSAIRQPLSGPNANRLPPRSPRLSASFGEVFPASPQSIRRPQMAPPSEGKAMAKKSIPRKSPSSDEGKVEGLAHASTNSVMHMQCTSNPACVALLKVLEDILNDQKNEELDPIYDVAARHVLLARNRMMNGKIPDFIGKSERFFTGAVANALNSVLKDGFCVLHQACLGTGFTHSDLSASRITAEKKPATLMVGEGKWLSDHLRAETRGQIFNELLRHRAVDKGCEENSRPILLFAFDRSLVEIDLAFPSTKKGKLEQDGVVEFSDTVDEGKETFWTVPILRMSIIDAEGEKNLPIVLRFIADAMQILNDWPEKRRVQCKMPMPLSHSDAGHTVSQYYGENVTIVENTEGSSFVYKEYCYHLRERKGNQLPLFAIEECDKRQPPPEYLLKKLGAPYSTDWKVHKGPLGITVLSYPLIEGESYNPSFAGWLQILMLVKSMHGIDMVHGDLLPRNVLFGLHGDGYVIDFDLSRKIGGKYVIGYNHTDFQDFRHPEAMAGKRMAKEHDIHSLRRMSSFFFEMEEWAREEFDLDGLIYLFETNSHISLRSDFSEIRDYNDKASGSPHRQV